MKRQQISICPICDERYDPFGDRAKIHDHPEPQSGPSRQQWFASKLTYEDWIEQTPEGREWHKSTTMRR